MKALNYSLLFIVCLTGPLLLNAQSQTMGGTPTHVIWDAPICTKIPGLKNRITWLSAEPVETKVYEVLRSADGINFSAIGSVIVPEQISTTYLFDDEQPLQFGYYQICSVSSLGKRTYSAKIKVVSATNNISIRQGYHSTTLFFKDNTTRVITLMNLNGQQLSCTSTSNTQHTLNTIALSKGIYLVKIYGEGLINVQRIMVL